MLQMFSKISANIEKCRFDYM